MAGKTALITGGSRGIGAAIARAFAAEGATIAVLHYKDSESARRTLDTLGGGHERRLALDCDVADDQQVRSAVATVSATFGGIDVLVNCAGIGAAGALDEMSIESWNQVIAVNLTGAFLVTRHCYPLMKRKGWGRVINISSQMAFSGGEGVSAYCASKAGLIGFTRGLAIEAARFGVLVNCIAPGATMTDMLRDCGEAAMAEILRKIPLGRFGRPEEIAATAVLLASEGGSFYAGQTLSPNGGDVFI